MFRYRIVLYRGSCIEVVRVFLCVWFCVCVPACLYVLLCDRFDLFGIHCLSVCVCMHLCDLRCEKLVSLGLFMLCVFFCACVRGCVILCLCSI